MSSTIAAVPALASTVPWFRLPGASQVVRELVPEAIKPAFWVITALGSSETLIVGLAILYWNSDRERALTVVGVGFAALTTVLVLKDGLAMPRPPAAVHNYPIEPSGYGFPSGHAIASSAIYGGLLLAYERHRDLKATMAVGTLVALIGLSRVILGVHYLGDILVGFAVGVTILGVQATAIKHRPERGFALAFLASPAALAVTSFGTDSLLAFSGSLAGILGALYLVDDRRQLTRRSRALMTGIGLLFVGILIVLQQVAEPFALALLALNFVLVVGIIGLPRAFHRSGITAFVEAD